MSAVIFSAECSDKLMIFSGIREMLSQSIIYAILLGGGIYLAYKHDSVVSLYLQL